MNKCLAPLAFIAFVGMAALCAAEPVAVPPNASTPAEPAATPEPSPAPRPLIGTASGVGNGIPLSGPAPAVVDPRMGTWRQQWYPPPDMPGQGVEVAAVGAAAGNANKVRPLLRLRILERLPSTLRSNGMRVRALKGRGQRLRPPGAF